MGISLDNGDRISLWDIIEGDKEHAFATILHPVIELAGDWN
jgi:hypothetical protein